jgi:hypothetical protein
MKQLLSLFLFLVPCLAWAQYPSNGNQKITLGEQTTADGLIWRGVASDTTLTVKSDTAAYFVLDTANINLYTYKASATGRKWRQLGVDTAAIAYVNTYGTQTVNGAKTFSAATTFSNTATATKFIPTDSVRAGYGMYRVNSKTVGINANGIAPFRITDDGNWGLIDENPQNLLTTFSSNARGGVISNSYPILMFNEVGKSKFVFGLDENEGYLFGFTDVKLIIATNGTEKMRVETSGNVGIATPNPTEKLHVVGNTRITGNVGIGVTTPTNAIDMVGQIRMTGATIASGLTKNINISGAQNFTDDEVKTISAGNVTFIMVSDNNTGGGALFFASYASGTVVKIADPSNFGAVTDLDGFVCVYKSASSATINVKNRLGSTKSITVSQITVGD